MRRISWKSAFSFPMRRTLYLKLLLMSWVFSQLSCFKKCFYMDIIKKLQRFRNNSVEPSRSPPRMAQRRHSYAAITTSDRILLAVQERDEVVSDEDAKIFQAFMLSLEIDDSEEDDEIFESITSSEWSFIYTEPEETAEENEEFL